MCASVNAAYRGASAVIGVGAGIRVGVRPTGAVVRPAVELGDHLPDHVRCEGPRPGPLPSGPPVLENPDADACAVPPGPDHDHSPRGRHVYQHPPASSSSSSTCRHGQASPFWGVRCPDKLSSFPIRRRRPANHPVATCGSTCLGGFSAPGRRSPDGAANVFQRALAYLSFPAGMRCAPGRPSETGCGRSQTASTHARASARAGGSAGAEPRRCRRAGHGALGRRSAGRPARRLAQARRATRRETPLADYDGNLATADRGAAACLGRGLAAARARAGARADVHRAGRLSPSAPAAETGPRWWNAALNRHHHRPPARAGPRELIAAHVAEGTSRPRTASSRTTPGRWTPSSAAGRRSATAQLEPPGRDGGRDDPRVRVGSRLLVLSRGCQRSNRCSVAVDQPGAPIVLVVLATVEDLDAADPQHCGTFPQLMGL